MLSKIIKRHVAENLKSYLEAHDLHYERQSGFQSNHSCETALTAFVDDWLSDIDRNEIVGTVFLDLSKAFDLVDHRLLLQKLKAYQFSDGSLQWFKFYFELRSQQVQFLENCQLQNVSSGVRQGSVLVPLLFLIFINDVPLEIKKSILDIFADNTILSWSGSSVEQVKDDFNEDAQDAVT